MPGFSDYEDVARRFRDAAYGLSPREVAKESGLDHMAVRDIIEEVDKGEFTVERRAGTVRKMEEFTRKRRAMVAEANGAFAADLERIYQEFDSAEDRLLARENLAAMMRADAAKAEARAAEVQGRAREREGEAAKIRARALYLAERRAMLVCRQATKPTGDGQERGKTLPPPGVADGSDP